MLGQDFIAAIEAKVQQHVGKFLGLKSILVSLQSSSSFTVRDRAGELFKRQELLEKELKEALKKIDNIKSGAYTFTDMASVGAFATAMTQQIKDVNSLAKGQPIRAGANIPWLPLLATGGIAIGIAAYAQRRR